MTHRIASLTILVFLATFGAIVASGRLDGDYRIDEVHKISETFFLRLIENGDFHHPAWLASPVERTNPPVGKILFGLAIQIAGQPLPADLTVAVLTENGRRLPPPAFDSQYRQWLRPVRIVSALATAATASIIFLAGAFASDAFGGLICATFYLMNFLAQTFSTTAVFDPTLTFFVLLAGVLALTLRRDGLGGSLAALAAALAFDVRVTGLVAFGACGLIFLLQRRFRALLWSALVFPLAAIALNPYYWVAGREPQFFPLRVGSRLLLQRNDLTLLLQREIAAQGALDTLGKKMAFLFQYALGDWIGIILLVGILCLLAAAIVSRHRTPATTAVAVWSTAVAAVITIWIPIAFPRYLLVAVPPLALLGGLGWRFAVMGVAEVARTASSSSRTGG